MRVTCARSSVISTQELCGALGQRVRKLRRRPLIYSSSCALEDVSVEFQDGTELQLVLKDLGPSGILESSYRVKPVFVSDPRREIETYRLILADSGLGTAVCYAAVVDDRKQHYWLLIEKVPGVQLFQIGDLHIWQAVARWLAEFHVWGSAVSEPMMAGARLLRHTRDFYRGWMQRAVAHAVGVKDSAALRWLAERHDRVVENLLMRRPTFIHGECYASNVLVQSGRALRVCPVDWEMAAFGPALMDLAALTAGSWTQAERDILAESYRVALEGAAGGSVERGQFSAALDCCRLQLALQWLGWSADWRPPREHATDWLAEALNAADRLGL